MTTNERSNRLAKEKSPYLLQHQYNPVDWFPWSEEAFEIAKRENKPVFLSIGYSTCHWCHVMERESFEDEEVAAILNEHYISIKVDREERPDVDHLYMSVCQAMTGQGGWPLTIVMTPDKKPFFAGTYYPKNRKYGRYGLMDLLPQLAEKWREDRVKVEEIGEQIMEETKGRMLSNLEGKLSEQTLDRAYRQYEELFDETYGGFGSAPKFPTAHNISLLLRYYKRTGTEQALEMAEKTLDSMYRGGMYDHIGFGFARYSTDERWLVPHFEKMLYDNALLAIAYLEAYQVTDKPDYAEVAERIFTYVLRDMTDPEGGFYSAEDADSEGHEGKFYVWKPDEIVGVLGAEDGDLYCDLYNITEEGNFEGHSIPNLIGQVPETFAKRKNMTLSELREKIESCRVKLFAYREERVHPHKDDKILTAWNGLMIAALAKGAKVLGNPAFAEAAAKAEAFLWTKLRREDGRLLARYRDGEAAFHGYVDDYAYMIWGLIELYEATFEPGYLQKAAGLAKDLIKLFWDDEKGGLFFYGHDAEQLLTRMKEIYDGAMPSGNSVAAYNLQRLSKYVYDAQLAQKADELLQAFAGAAERYPSGHAMLLTTLDFAVSSPMEIVIAGDPEKTETKRMLESVRSRFLPSAVVILVPNGEKGDVVRQTIPLVQDKVALGGRTTAYVCEHFACFAPTDDPEELEELLDQ
ncbi:thioredoxin domain-containing protein [Paenibacillus mesophilus]|uniref:thioredoxin domain-containing protein n=1 Tax=Paenibacillus mesophilus TaxID=2582849 RepID=UPI00110E203F|nr:thioredoxin domain-containing protein [Paenibacillus mesophilus]TMV51943.1 thioredoxin domain-containing protein [Paenibacillus mesophilus]